MKKKILFFIHFNSYFESLFGVARLVKNSSDREPILIFPIEYPNLSRDIDKVLLAGIRCLDKNGKPINSYSKINSFDNSDQTQPIPNGRKQIKSNVNRYMQFINRGLKRLFRFFEFSNNLVSRIKYYRQRIKFIRKLICREKISLIVVGGDIIGHDMSAIIKAGHIENVFSIAIVGWLGDHEGADIYFQDSSYGINNIYNRLAYAVFKRWRYSYHGKKILRLPAVELLALELTGLSPKLPWILHSGSIDAIAVEGERLNEAAVLMGLPVDKLFVTGSIQHDLMKYSINNAEILRSDLYRELGLTSCFPMILVALPPNMMYSKPECEFESYEALVEFWLKSLSKLQNYNIIVSLHPSEDFDKMKYIEQWGVKISKHNTCQLIPLSDIFVACISATIQWAIVCAKPVINYDVYRYGYSDYINIEGVLTMEDKYEFLKILHKLSNDKKFYQEIVEKQANFAVKCGQLDGLAGARILNLFERFL